MLYKNFQTVSHLINTTSKQLIDERRDFFKKPRHFECVVANAIFAFLQCFPIKDLMALSRERRTMCFYQDQATQINKKTCWNLRQQLLYNLTFIRTGEIPRVSEVSHFATIDSLQKLKNRGCCFPVSFHNRHLSLPKLSEKGGFVVVVFANVYSVNSVFHYFKKSIPVHLQNTFKEGGTGYDCT